MDEVSSSGQRFFCQSGQIPSRLGVNDDVPQYQSIAFNDNFGQQSDWTLTSRERPLEKVACLQRHPVSAPT